VDGLRLGRSVTRGLGTAAMVGGLILGAVPGLAQISPGTLSRSHSELEGSGMCGRCHEAGRGVVPEKCLECHRALGERIHAGRGLHARPEYRDCKTCHIDHQGAEFELVWWGKQGRGAFDHLLTGYTLEGRHARLVCDDCHQPRFNRQREALAAQGVDLARTYLGLATSCTDCHADEHRGQFAAKECTSCHDQSHWKPAPGFDHAKTSYPLTGRHAAVACAKCHQEQAADPANPTLRYVQFKAVSGHSCASCHEDVHRARLGTSCESCHTTADWFRVERARFDHGRTDYPLEGRHSDVACDRCHTRGAPRPLPHERCTSCHADAHFGQLAARADRGACEACHTVNGFSPARYGPGEHQKTDYPLTGAHLAVACNACHTAATVAELRKNPGVHTSARASERSPRLRFASTRCRDCHRDVHRGDVDRWVKEGGCESCHSVKSWRGAAAAFDHGRTRFELVAEHAKTACADCHERVDAGTPREHVRFAGAPLTCQGCHVDTHRGQFKASEKPASCERCHAPKTLKASRFDHTGGSRWPLDGAHARVSCDACHRRETRDGISFVRYKPLPTTCRGCHAPSQLLGKDVKAR
jgi:hypothetical protein